MREILFRGKTFNDEWVEGALVKWSKAHSIIRKYGSDTIGLYEYSVVPESISQFTGCYDKNGKKIFDGDIIKAADAAPEYNLIVIRAEGYGFFNDYYFGGEKYDTEQISDADWFLCDEVIGNIHDNPELLEVTNPK